METINHFQCFDYMIDSANDILDEDFMGQSFFSWD